jgi:hypothetical protein
MCGISFDRKIAILYLMSVMDAKRAELGRLAMDRVMRMEQGGRR